MNKMLLLKAMWGSNMAVIRVFTDWRKAQQSHRKFQQRHPGVIFRIEPIEVDTVPNPDKFEFKS